MQSGTKTCKTSFFSFSFFNSELSKCFCFLSHWLQVWASASSWAFRWILAQASSSCCTKQTSLPRRLSVHCSLKHHSSTSLNSVELSDLWPSQLWWELVISKRLEVVEICLHILVWGFFLIMVSVDKWVLEPLLWLKSWDLLTDLEDFTAACAGKATALNTQKCLTGFVFLGCFLVSTPVSMVMTASGRLFQSAAVIAQKNKGAFQLGKSLEDLIYVCHHCSCDQELGSLCFCLVCWGCVGDGWDWWVKSPKTSMGFQICENWTLCGQTGTCSLGILVRIT